MAKEVILPRLGVTMDEGKILRWLKKEGDYVEKDEPLYEIETDKASMEVESMDEGYIRKIIVEEGIAVPVATIVAIIGDKHEDITKYINNINSNKINENPAAGTLIGRSHAEKNDETQKGQSIIATPRARKIARENGLDLNKITGTGGNGRITEEDIEKYIEDNCNSASSEQIPLEGIRKIIADKLSKSYIERPHTYFTNEVCMDKCINYRSKLKEQGESVTISDLIIKAVAGALNDYPKLNSSLMADTIIIHKEINIGFAVDAPNGLIVPVIFSANKKSIYDIAKDRTDIVKKAMNNSLKVQEIQGGTFTVSNLGTHGIDSFTAIINPPECGILAVSSIKKKLIVGDDDTISIKPIMNITLSVDHRIVDGAAAAKFINKIKENLELASF